MKYTLVINGYELVLGQDFAPKFSKTIITPSSPASKSTEFSYSFTLPMVVENTKVLGASATLYEKNKFVRRFNATLYIGEAAIFKGELYISEINKEGYKCNLVKTSKQASDVFEDAKIRDIEWIKPAFTLSEVFDNNIATNPDYILPLAAYGLLPKLETSTKIGNVYLYTDKNVIDSYNYFSITDYPLSVNLKKALENMFEKKGYSLGGSFIKDSKTDGLFVSFQNGDNEIPYNWGSLGRFSCHMKFQTQKWHSEWQVAGYSTATGYESKFNPNDDSSQTLLVQDLLSNTTISNILGTPEAFYNHNDNTGKHMFYVPTTGYYAVHLEGTVMLQDTFEQVSSSQTTGDLTNTGRYSRGDYWTFNPYLQPSSPGTLQVGVARGEIQMHISGGADRSPESYTFLSQLSSNPDIRQSNPYPAMKNTMTVDVSKDENFVMGASFGYNSPFYVSSYDFQTYHTPSIGYSMINGYDRSHTAAQFNQISWTSCTPEMVAINSNGKVGGQGSPSVISGDGWYRLVTGDAMYLTASGSVYTATYMPLWENELVIKNGYSSDAGFSQDDFVRSLYQFPSLSEYGYDNPYYGSYLDRLLTRTYKNNSNLYYADSFFITGDTEPRDTEKISNVNNRKKRFCNNVVLYLKKGDRIYFDYVGNAQEYSGNAYTAAIEAELDFGIRYINDDAESLMLYPNQYTETEREINNNIDVNKSDLNLNEFLPDIQVTQFITDICNYFNMSLNHVETNQFSLDYNNYVSNTGNVYKLQPKFSDDSFSYSPLNIPYEYKIDFKIDEKEEGYDCKYKNAESGYKGNAEIITNNPNGDIFTKTTNLSYCWYKPFLINGTQTFIPIISENSVWTPDYINGARNPRSYNNYAADLGNKFFNLPYRLWYKDGTNVIQVMNKNFAKVVNTKSYDLSYDATKDNSLINNCYFLIKRNQGYVIEKKMYLSPLDYENFNSYTKIGLQDDVYLPYTISSFDGTGENPTQIKLIKLQ